MSDTATDDPALFTDPTQPTPPDGGAPKKRPLTDRQRDVLRRGRLTNAERVAQGLPPRGRPPGTKDGPTDTSPRPHRATKKRFKPALMEYVASMGMVLTATGMARANPTLVYDGQILLAGAEQWADAMEALAAENPNVRRVLEVVVQTSAWSMVGTATAAMLVPILAAHGVLPSAAATIFGADVPPEPPQAPPVDFPETGDPPNGNGVWPPTDNGVWAPGPPPPHHMGGSGDPSQGTAEGVGPALTGMA